MFIKFSLPKNLPGYRGFVRLVPIFTLAALNGAAAQPVLPEERDDPRRKNGDAEVMTVTAPRGSPLTVVTSPRTPRQPVPASDGADYLKTIPGFSQVRNGGTNGDPVFRGMFGSRLKILASGAEVLGACPGRMDAPTAYISPESFDLLTLVKGPQTVLWGPGASAGVVRFERTRPRFDQGMAGADAGLLAGSNRRLDKNIDARLGSDRGYLQLIGTQSRAGDYRDGAYRRVPSRWNKWSGDAVLGWTPDADTLVEFSGGKGDGEASYAGRGMDGSQFRHERLGARFEKQDIGRILDKLDAQIYYGYANHVMDNTTLRTPAKPSACCCKSMRHAVSAAKRKNLDRRTVGGRVVTDWLWRDLKLQSGVDMQADSHRGKTDRTWFKDAQFAHYGAFGELTWFAGETSRYVGGARIDRHRGKKYGFENQQSRSAATPAGFVRYEHRPAALPFMFYAGLGYIERFPDYWELFSPSAGPGGGAPFTNLKSEKTSQIDIGAHYSGAKYNGWISAYLGRVNDFILIKYDPQNANRSQADNTDAVIMGGEVGLEYPLTERWKADAALAYSWGKNSRDGRPLPQMPPLEARVGLVYEREQWSAAGLWRVVSSQRRVALNEGNVVGKDFDAGAGFGVLSANVAFKLTEQVKISSGIDNIFNKRYSEHLNLAGNSGFGYSANEPVNEPGRTVWAKLNVSF
ncbi:TonB-dependent copper receptor [Sodalis ligni]|uniref:Iron complex outermembrane receptor protein n=1 Tax=Sodalis ligni TaxID=2697027 RepID=A0A4R1NQW8_9GAMM|nr:TonB-dependent copper receptor [Sodalis ligni]TCL07176.1 iron complex outermembrane receptor protein [Sodalis ligni]